MERFRKHKSEVARVNTSHKIMTPKDYLLRATKKLQAAIKKEVKIKNRKDKIETGSLFNSRNVMEYQSQTENKKSSFA